MMFMAFAQSTGARLFVETTGSGFPVVFVHEFGGDYRSWDDQVRALSRHYQCITFNARGFPPSEVPEDEMAYGYEQAAADIAAVMDHFRIGHAHVVGLSMGGYAALILGIQFPRLARSLVIAGCGAGSDPSERPSYVRNIPLRADRLFTEGITLKVKESSEDSTRLQLSRKDSKGWQVFLSHMGEQSAIGSSLTLRNVQGKRPSLQELEPELKRLATPTLVIAGDEDEHCLAPGLYLKRTIPNSGLWVVPRTGHAVNLEEPDAFNREILDFFGAVERGSWQPR
jgi:pimeloyl-ACP methyl ester carboxylesterase